MEAVTTRRRDWLICLAVFLAFALLVRLAGRAGLTPPTLPDPAALDASTRQAPDFRLATLAGETRSLGDFAGHVLFVNFWASWCPPCLEELPALEALHRALAGDGLAVVAVSLDRGSREQVARFVADRGLSFTVLHDPDGESAERFGVRAYPTSFVIDRSGRILYAVPSAWDWASPEALAWLRAVLAR